MKSNVGMIRRTKIMTLLMALLFLWGAVGQLFVHVCCEHCHDGFFIETASILDDHAESGCCSSISKQSNDDHQTELTNRHHCDCTQTHNVNTEESKIESILPLLHTHEYLLYACKLAHVIPQFAAITTHTRCTTHCTHTATALDGRGVLLQSRILII